MHRAGLGGAWKASGVHRAMLKLVSTGGLRARLGGMIWSEQTATLMRALIKSHPGCVRENKRQRLSSNSFLDAMAVKFGFSLQAVQKRGEWSS